MQAVQASQQARAPLSFHVPASADGQLRDCLDDGHGKARVVRLGEERATHSEKVRHVHRCSSARAQVHLAPPDAFKALKGLKGQYEEVVGPTDWGKFLLFVAGVAVGSRAVAALRS